VNGKLRNKSTSRFIYIAVGMVTAIFVLLLVVENRSGTLSRSSKSCQKCHLLDNSYNTWKDGSHKEHATCSDCHLPHRGTSRYMVFQAKNAIKKLHSFVENHSLSHDRMGNRAKNALYENCLRCHQEQVFNTLRGSMETRVSNPEVAALPESQKNCLKCHTSKISWHMPIEIEGTQLCWRCHRGTAHARR
jgi:cytochrome c nitrite reductase small subunit